MSEYKKMAVPNTVLPPVKKMETPDKMETHDGMKKAKSPEMESEHMNRTPEEVKKRQAEYAQRKARKDMERKKRGMKIGPNIYGGGVNPNATGTKVSNV
jgi:hypothetical protein